MHRFIIVIREFKRNVRRRVRRAFLLLIAKALQEAASTRPMDASGDLPRAGEPLARDAMPELAVVAGAARSADKVENVQSAPAKSPQEQERDNKQNAPNIHEVQPRRVTRLPSREDERHLRLLADLATAIWRLRQRMLVPGTGQPREQLAREYRDLEAVWDVLSAMQFEIQDHTGKQFDSGQSLRVATWIPVAGIEHDRVQETIKPTIYCAGAQIQRGIVIVETPERTPSA